jgi:hypothetical protein
LPVFIMPALSSARPEPLCDAARLSEREGAMEVVMSDFHNPDRQSELEHRNLAAMNRKSSSWSWLWALIVIGFFAAIIVAGHNNSSQTAQNAPPAATNGQATLPSGAAPRPPSTAANPLSGPPASRPTTTGQAPADAK